MNAVATSVTAKASPARRTRPAKRKRAPTCRREVAVYDGQDFLGIVKIAGHATAYNPDGKRIGVFRSQEAAIAALDKPRVRP
jgi:hypothetical protein